MASWFRTIMYKICGLDERFEVVNERLTLIEQTIGINNFMSIGEGNVGNVGSGNVGIGSTVPPDVARYQELAAAQSSSNVGSGNVGNGNVGSGNVGSGNVGVSSTDTPTATPTSTDVSDPVSGRVSECGIDPAPSAVVAPPTSESADDGNVGDGNVGNVGDGNVGNVGVCSA